MTFARPQHQGAAYILYSQCPNCKTIFGIRSKQLQAAQGQVRCGNCFRVFSAPKYFVTPPQRSLSPLPPSQIIEPSTLKNQSIEGAPSHKSPSPAAAASLSPTNTKRLSFREKRALKKQKAALDWLNSHQATLAYHQRQQKKYYLFITITLFILMSQIVFFQYHNPMFRSHIERFLTCRFNNCPALDKIILLNQSVNPNTHNRNKVTLALVMQNNANYPQPYANLQVAFKDTHDKTLDSLVFTPNDYLHLNSAGKPPLMPHHHPINIELDLNHARQHVDHYEVTLLENR